MLLSDDIDNTGYGIRAIESRLCAFHYLDSLNIVRVDKTEVVLATHITVNALAVNKNEYVVVTQSVELCL